MDKDALAKIVAMTTAAKLPETDAYTKGVFIDAIAKHGREEAIRLFKMQYPGYSSDFILNAKDSSGHTGYVKLKAQNKSAEKKMYQELVKQGVFKKKAYVTDVDIMEMWRLADSGNYDTGNAVIEHKSKSKEDSTWEGQAKKLDANTRIKKGYMAVTSKSYRADLRKNQLALPRAADVADLKLPDAMTTHIQQKAVIAVLHNHEDRINELEMRSLGFESRLALLEGSSRSSVVQELTERGLNQTQIATMLSITTRTVRRDRAKQVN